VPAAATLRLDLIDERIRAIREATVKAPARMRGCRRRSGATGELAAAITRVDVPRLIVGATNASASLARRPQGGWRVELRGSSFDDNGD